MIHLSDTFVSLCHAELQAVSVDTRLFHGRFPSAEPEHAFSQLWGDVQTS